jgi:hypothetical protein
MRKRTCMLEEKLNDLFPAVSYTKIIFSQQCISTLTFIYGNMPVHGYDNN